eukprot:6151654-Alexandrium_andersonii.AAC.1
MPPGNIEASEIERRPPPWSFGEPSCPQTHGQGLGRCCLPSFLSANISVVVPPGHARRGGLPPPEAPSRTQSREPNNRGPRVLRAPTSCEWCNGG